MLKKLKVITIVISLLFINVFANAFAGVSVFASLNFGNETISSINMVKQCSQIAMMPSKFVDMCIVLENELTSFGFSGKTEMFISKQIVNTVKDFVLFANCRINNTIKYVAFYGVRNVNNFSANNSWVLFMFLIMLSFITEYLGLLTAKNKGNNIITYMNSIKLCPIW